MEAGSNHRRRLPIERKSQTVHCTIDPPDVQGTVDFYLTASAFEDGSLGEVFIKLGTKSDTVQGMLDAWCITLSIALQHGADFEAIVRKLAGMKFSPAGDTDDPHIPTATSIVDYTMRWLAQRYGSLRLNAELDEFV